MVALESKGHHFEKHWQILYITNLRNVLYTTNRSGPVTISDVLSQNLTKFHFKAAKLVVWIITKLQFLTGASAVLVLGACKISEWLYNFKHKSRGFETSRGLMIRCLIRYWYRALVGDKQAWVRVYIELTPLLNPMWTASHPSST